ncbi:MAG: hypothetical protein KC649_03945, partial [Candidatus Omnitrophica bacterium]|nr:hypothetical protein [Candidatus Omnitrophota bacterium]
MDENFDSSGKGRLAKVVNADGTYSLYQYWGDSGLIQSRSDYDNSGNLIITEIFDTDGVSLLRQIFANGDIKEYDPSGWLTGITFHTGIVYEFYNDSYYNPGEGRLSKVIAVDGTYTVYIGYYKDTDNSFIQKDYDADDALLETRYYDISGNQIPGAIVAFYPSGSLKSLYNPATKIQTLYLDEDFYENSVGRPERLIFEEQTELRMTYPDTQSSNPDTQSLYINDSLYRTDTFNASSQLVSRVYQDGDALTYYSTGNLHTAVVDSTIQAGEKLTYEYSDEDYYGDGVGRLHRIILQDGSYYVFTEYWNDTDTRKTAQYFDASDNLLETFTYDITGAPEEVQGETILTTYGNSVSKVLVGNKYAAWVAAWGFNPSQSYVYLRDLVKGTHKSIDTQYSSQSTYTPLSINDDKGVLTQETYPDGRIYLKYYSKIGPTVLTSGLTGVKNPVLNQQGIVIWTKDNRLYRHESGATGVLAAETGEIYLADLSDEGYIAWFAQSDAGQVLRLYNRDTRQTATVTEGASLNIQSLFIGDSGELYWNTNDASGDKLYYYNGSSIQEITPAATEGQFELLTKTSGGKAVWKSRTTVSPGVFTDELYMTYQTEVVKLTDEFETFSNPDINSSGHVAWIQTGTPASVHARINGTSVKIADLTDSDGSVFITENNIVVWFDQNQVFAYTGGSIRTLETGYVSRLFGVNDDLTVFFEDADLNLVEAKISLTSDYSAPPDACPSDSTCSYYANGRLKRTTQSSGAFTEYRDELFYGINIGRKSIESDGSGTEIRFTQYWGDFDPATQDDSDIVKVKETYVSGELVRKDTYNQDQSISTTETYFTPSGRTATSFDASTGITFDYIDEDFNNTGQGRVTKKTYGDGSYITYTEYFSDSLQPRWIREYTAEGILIREKEYDSEGNQIIHYNSLLTLFETQADPNTGMPQSHQGESSSLV